MCTPKGLTFPYIVVEYYNTWYFFGTSRGDELGRARPPERFPSITSITSITTKTTYGTV